MSDDLKKFLCEFPYDGTRWAVDVYARDADDAKRRLERIGANGVVLGELAAEIPVLAGGFLVPLVTSFLNWWRGSPHA